MGKKRTEWSLIAKKLSSKSSACDDESDFGSRAIMAKRRTNRSRKAVELLRRSVAGQNHLIGEYHTKKKGESTHKNLGGYFYYY